VRQRDDLGGGHSPASMIKASSASRSAFWLATSSIFDSVLSMSEEGSTVVPIERQGHVTRSEFDG